MITRCGPFELDALRRELRREGTVVHLTPKAFDLLTFLVGEAPRVVSKAELHQHLWPDTFVSDATLVGLVKELRRSLDDHDPDAPLIRTVHRVGYAFARDLDRAQPREASVCHWLVVSRRRVALREGENLIGRDPSSHVWLDSASISRTHARLMVGPDHVVVEDRGSKNGTWIGERRVADPMPVRDGDRLRFGTVTAVYRASGAGMSTETQRRSEFTDALRARRTQAAGPHGRQGPTIRR